MKNLSVLAALVGCLTLAPVAFGEDDFDAIDKMLDQNFDNTDQQLETRYQQLDKAMEAAYQRLGKEVAERWGKDQVALPSRKVWVDYSPDLKTRRIFNFEQGTIQLDRLVDTGDDTAAVVDDMVKAASSVTRDSADDLAGKDLALKWAKEDLAKQGIELAQPPAEDATPVLKDVAKDLDTASIKAAVEKAVNTPAPARETIARPKQSVPELAMTTTVEPVAGKHKRKVSIRVPFNANYKTKLANRYAGDVTREANKRDIPPSLVLAVMETESSFNPRATSPIPAYGLMQLVPASGAMDAYRYIHGRKILVGPDYLYDASQNVELGSAYLSLLDSRYLRAITNDESREYCTIAAYNTGAGNVARAFTGNTNIREAAKIINTMTPVEVYKHLQTRLPYEETRNYIRKVTEAQKRYFSYDEAWSGASL